MSENLQLGQIITTHQERDAIHVAVLPVITGEALLPGQHVGFSKNGYRVVSAPVEPYRLVGIIDPFLTGPVDAEKRVWLFLYPNTIQSLRHNWAHPAISSTGLGVGSSSEKWLRDFADSVDADYSAMMEVAESHCGESKWGDYLIEGGKWEGQGTPDEFWIHFQNVTGKAPKELGQKGAYLPGIFSCSC